MQLLPDSAIREARIPQAHVRMTLDRYPKNSVMMKRLIKFLTQARDRNLDGYGLFIRGEIGAGRTAVAVQVMLHLLYYGYSSYYVSLDTLVSMSMTDEPNDDGATFNRLVNEVQCLCIDNISRDNVADRKAGYYRALQTAMQRRADLRQPTLLVSTLNFKTFAHHYGETSGSLLDRFYVDIPVGGSKTDDVQEAKRRKIELMYEGV